MSPLTSLPRVLVLDLDDTLYAERTYVRSGLRAVARHLQREYGWNPRTTFGEMLRVLQRHGRGAVFDHVLEVRGVCSRSAVRACVGAYRRHIPRIRLWPAASRFLAQARCRPCYLVSDGNSLVQQRKVDALGLEGVFRHVYLTHRYGLRRAKPSSYCFRLIKARERCRWRDMAYIGDDPSKDFVGLNRLGVLTVRVRTGRHRAVRAAPAFEACAVVPTLDSLTALLTEGRR